MNDSGYAAIALSVLGVICMLVPGGQFISSMLFAMADVVGIASSSAQVSLGVREKDKENIGFGIASVALSAVDLGGIAKSVSTSKRIASLLSDFAEQNGIRNAGHLSTVLQNAGVDTHVAENVAEDFTFSNRTLSNTTGDFSEAGMFTKGVNSGASDMRNAEVGIKSSLESVEDNSKIVVDESLKNNLVKANVGLRVGKMIRTFTLVSDIGLAIGDSVYGGTLFRHHIFAEGGLEIGQALIDISVAAFEIHEL